jgi:hypothetical protein
MSSNKHGSDRSGLRQELGGVKPPAPPAAAKVERVVPEPRKVVKLKHHESCQEVRQSSPATPQECTCEANLVWLAESGVKPLERITMTWTESDLVEGTRKMVERKVELWKVDNGRHHEVTVPEKSALKRPVKRVLRLEPRWVCTRCGWAGRGSHISHRCDMAAVRRQQRLSSVAAALPFEQRTSGAYRLAIWKDADAIYHLVEELVVDAKVVEMVEIDRDGNYNVIEGALLSAAVDGFDP